VHRQAGLGAALERLRRGGARDLECRREAAGRRGGGTERDEAGDRQRIEDQRRGDAGEIAAPEVATEQLDREACDDDAEDGTEQAAEAADRRALDDDLAQQMARRPAECAQQGEFATPAHDGQHLCREHQESAREQRNEREHVEIDAVGTREVAGTHVGILGDGHEHAIGQHCGEARPHRLDIAAGLQADGDARQLAEPRETPLRRAEVQRREALARPRTRQAAGDAEHDRSQPGLQLERLPWLDTEPGLSSRRKEQRIVGEQGQTLLVLRHAQQLRRHAAGAEQVDADQLEDARLVGGNHQRVDLDQRARHRDGGIGGDALEHRIVEAAARTAHFEVGLAGRRAHRLRELARRRRVDELHGESERDTDGDRRQRGNHAPGMGTQLAPGQPDTELRSELHGADGSKPA